jgi:fructokinase
VMPVDCVQTDADRQTGIVPVTLADGQPTYEIVEGVAWDAIEWVDAFHEVLEKADAFCFGTLAQRASGSRRTTEAFLGALGDRCLRVLDINFRQHYHSREVVEKSLRHTDLLKLNDEELGILRDYVGGDEDDGQFLKEILDRYGIERAVLTLGKDGCRIIDRSIDISVPAEPQRVVNTVGAGDAFAAAFVLHQLAGHDARTCAEMANRAGGFVTTQDSGTPVFPGEYRVC